MIRRSKIIQSELFETEFEKYWIVHDRLATLTSIWVNYLLMVS